MYKKYFSRSNGLISFAVKKNKKIEVFIDSLKLFKIGFSWGGYESLILPINQIKPTMKKLDDRFWFRIHIGLESYLDMIEDLENGFKNYEKNRFLIFQPPKSAMQSGLLNTKKWCLTNCEMNESFINSRFCWLGSSNPERQIRLFFDTLDSAERFAKKININMKFKNK